MPRITASTTINKIPANSSRRALFLRVSADVLWGWESTLTSSGGTVGPALLANETLCLSSPDVDAAAAIYFITASGTATVDYTEQF